MTNHRKRKLTHLVCFFVFVALPFLNVMRFDIPRQRFYFGGYELWISEFGIIFFAIMFLMFVVVAVSMIYGRLYCSYACPQMIFSEASIALESKLRRLVNRNLGSLSAKQRNLAARGAFLAIVGAASVFLAFVFISYFVEPRDLFLRLVQFDIRTAGGISGASVTLLTFLDFTLLRQRFCTTVCPYGYLQGMLVDGNTLLVQYRDDAQDCIECKKCVRVCHMGIDIRDSPYQMECVHCGECIDACGEVLSRLGKGTLIHYVWGEHGGLLAETRGPWYRRLGLRDARRVIVMLVILFYASGLGVALSMRKPVLVQVAPDRSTLYRTSADGKILNRFRIRVANRGSVPATVGLSAEGLPGASVTLTDISVQPGEEIQSEFDVQAPKGSQDVNHFTLLLRVSPPQPDPPLPMTFIMPVGVGPR
jgi:cytochrome c oxidase accessory protein FixG